MMRASCRLVARGRAAPPLGSSPRVAHSAAPAVAAVRWAGSTPKAAHTESQAAAAAAGAGGAAATETEPPRPTFKINPMTGLPEKGSEENVDGGSGAHTGSTKNQVGEAVVWRGDNLLWHGILWVVPGITHRRVGLAPGPAARNRRGQWGHRRRERGEQRQKLI